MAQQKVTVYTRQNGSRKYQITNPKNTYPMGTIFVLRYKQGGRRVWETLAGYQNYQTAKALAMRKEIELFTGEVNEPAKPIPAPKPKPVVAADVLNLDVAIDQYLHNTKTKSDRTASSYTYTMSQFYKSCGNKPVKSVTQQDLINFVSYLQAEGLSDRTVHNRIGEVVTFLRTNGVKDVKLRVKFVEKTVRAYRPDELKALFSAATPDEGLLFQFFLCTGAREQEVMFAEWGAIDFTDKVFHIRQTAQFTPKDFEEREIPLPDFLVDALKRQARSDTLIFSTPEGKPNGHMLRPLKALAERAGLAGDFGLHKFRKTYATLQHKDGVDARTIQKRLGHSDLTTTLAYLEGEDARSERSRQQVNGTFAAFA